MSNAIAEALVLMIGAAILAGLIVWLLLRNRSSSLRAENESLGRDYADLEHRLNVQSNELEDLQGAYKSLDARLKTCTGKRTDLESQLTLLTPYRKKYEELEKEHTALKAQGTTVAAPAFPDLRSTVKDLEAEIARLKQAATQPAAPKETAAAEVSKEAPAADASAKEEAILARIRQKAGDINFERIGLATAADRDPLQRIKGIGPFIEKKLNSIGIFAFRQIAAFNAEDETTVNKAIEFFPGRIKRDKWSDQAAAFDKEKEEKKG